ENPRENQSYDIIDRGTVHWQSYPMRNGFKSLGAVTLAVSGVAGAFAIAACCAIPIVLAGFGLSAYWLVPIAEWGQWLGYCLTVASILALAGAAFLVIRAPKTCLPGELCA